MKEYNRVKSFQLVLFILITGILLYVIIGNSDIFQNVGHDINLMILCISLWAVLGLSFVFIYMDFHYLSLQKRNLHEQEYATNYDPISGIANRFSIDSVIAKYADHPLPEKMGCVTFVFTSLYDINRQAGHIKGNQAIRDFANLLQKASKDTCFIGRNGGNNFIAIFEYAEMSQIQAFLARFEENVKEYNEEQKLPIEYKYGYAYEEGKTITNLISISNKRVIEA